MREVNLAGIDLNLLPAFEALLRLRNVTQAAAEVGLSQPAMSRALARLRETFGDPLLIRAGGALAPSPLAESLAPKVAAALEDLRGLFQTPAFDPATLRRVIRIAAADVQTILLAPGLVARIREEAPGVDLRFEPIGRDIIRRMEQGAVDLCFATASTPLPPGFLSERLARDRLALVMRRGHPGANREWTLADYAASPHVTMSFFGDGLSEVDARLASAGLSRRIALTTPYFMGAISTVAETDLVTTISAAFARAVRRRIRSRPARAALRRHARDDRRRTAASSVRRCDAMVPQGAAGDGRGGLCGAAAGRVQSMNASPASLALRQTMRAVRAEYPPVASRMRSSKVWGRQKSSWPVMRAPPGAMSRTVTSSVEAALLKTQLPRRRRLERSERRFSAKGGVRPDMVGACRSRLARG